MVQSGDVFKCSAQLAGVEINEMRSACNLLIINIIIIIDEYIYVSGYWEGEGGGQFRAGKEDVLQRNNGPIVGGNTRRTISYKENYMKLWSTERNTSDFSSTKDKSLLFLCQLLHYIHTMTRPLNKNVEHFKMKNRAVQNQWIYLILEKIKKKHTPVICIH